jgi:hypothetical protein
MNRASGKTQRSAPIGKPWVRSDVSCAGIDLIGCRRATGEVVGVVAGAVAVGLELTNGICSVGAGLLVLDAGAVVGLASFGGLRMVSAAVRA